MENQKLLRFDGRTSNQVRPISLTYDIYSYADSSLLFELGNTKVLVSVTLQDGVPPFLRGQKTGWLTAEYCMLPCATQKRTVRESSLQNRNSRSVEISRLIGRSLRNVVDFASVGERTIIVDCDVLQADGGTRVASVTAASLALKLACKRWLDSGLLDRDIFKENIVAISAGVVEGNFVLDLNYQEDSQAEADFNFILTETGNIVELQGTAEKSPVLWQDFESFRNLALDGIKNILQETSKFVPQNKVLNLEDRKILVKNNNNINNNGFNNSFKKTKTNYNHNNHYNNQVMQNKPAFFSLANRLEKKI